MSIAWEAADFTPVDDGGLGTDLEGVSVTLLSRGDAYLVNWAVQLGNATLPDTEAVVERIAAVIRRTLDEEFGVKWTDG